MVCGGGGAAAAAAVVVVVSFMQCLQARVDISPTMVKIRLD